MEMKKKTLVRFSVPVLILAVLMFSTEAYAYGRDGKHDRPRKYDSHNNTRGRQDDKRPSGQDVSKKCDDEAALWVGLGVLLASIAVVSIAAASNPKYQKIDIGGVTYYYSNNQYFLKDSRGQYVLVRPPIMAQMPQQLTPMAYQQPIYSY